MQTLAIIDFETTGLSPAQGDRATEIAAVIVENGQVVRRYQSLMNAGIRIPSFITSLTGITNDMVRRAPAAFTVMNQVADFVGDLPLVAHNASFDKKFWLAELGAIQRNANHSFACSMLVARRLFPQSPNHKLETLSSFLHLPTTGKAHRAMADTEMTAQLLLHTAETLLKVWHINNLTHGMLQTLQRTPVANVEKVLQKWRSL